MIHVSTYRIVILEICFAVQVIMGSSQLRNDSRPFLVLDDLVDIGVPQYAKESQHSGIIPLYNDLEIDLKLDIPSIVESPENPWFSLVDQLKVIYQYVDIPRRNISEIVDVHFAFYILSIADIIERDETLVSYGWITLDWRDDYLKWNASKFKGIAKLSTLFSQHTKNRPIDLWTPQIISHNKKAVMNSADQLLSTENFLAPDVHQNGHVHLESVGILATHCVLRMRKFPFDKQICHLTFGSTDRVRLLCTTKDEMFNNMTLDRILGNNPWQLDSANCEEKRNPFYRNNEIVIELRLSRKPEFYVNLIVAPCAVIALLGVLVFVLPTDSGEKVSLGITLLLSFVVFLTIISDRMPQSSDETPLLTLYLQVSMCLSALSLLATVIVLNISSNGLPDCTPNPKHDTPRCHYNPPASRDLDVGKNSDDHFTVDWSMDNGTDGNPLDISSKRNQGQSAAEVTLEYVQLQTSVRSVVEGAAEVRRQKHVDERWLRFGRRLDRVLLILFLLASICTVSVFMGVCPFTEC